MQKCRNARMQKCKNVETQNAEMQECRMQECNAAISYQPSAFSKTDELRKLPSACNAAVGQAES
jgi:hypothetical protein